MFTYRYFQGNRKYHEAHFKLWILIAALLSTITTTGQILLILMLVFRFALSRPKSQFNRLIKLMAFLCVAVVGGYVAIMIFIMKSSSRSWMIRADDFIAGFRTWLSSPLWGKGFNDLNVIDFSRSIVKAKHATNRGFSNSITMVLAQGGVLLALIYLLPVYWTIRGSYRRRDIATIMFAAIFSLEFIFTVCAYQSVMLFFTAFFYAMKITEMGERNEYRIIDISRSL